MTRKLSAKYTLDKKDDMEFYIEDEVYTELAKNIQHSMDQERLYNLCIMQGWHGAIVSYQQLDEVKEWVETNKLGEVCWFNIKPTNSWFDIRIAFEQSKDYEWFILRWS